MMTRKQYLDREDTVKAHREYYGQFVTPEIKRIVLRFLTLQDLHQSKDPHFNDISLSAWDLMHSWIPESVKGNLKKAGDSYALVSSCCIYKEAARQLKEETGPI